MGKCWNCGTEVILRDEEVRCDRCKKIVRYWCHSCKQPFDVQDRETKKKVRECKWCGFFLCPNCDTCGIDCSKDIHIKIVEGLLAGIIPLDKWNIAQDKIKKIVDYFEDIKLGREQTQCAFGVPKSYAKDRIKGILARMDGFKTKGIFDKEAFEKKQEEVLDKPCGYELTIGNTRDNGTYGQEYRDVFNLCVCLGKLKYKKKSFKNKKGIEVSYDAWIRIEETPCLYFDDKEIIVKHCPKCKKTFTRDKQICDECVWKNNGKNHIKGDLKQIPLVEKISDNPTCKNLNNFTKGGKQKEDGESESEENIEKMESR